MRSIPMHQVARISWVTSSCTCINHIIFVMIFRVESWVKWHRVWCLEVIILYHDQLQSWWPSTVKLWWSYRHLNHPLWQTWPSSSCRWCFGRSLLIGIVFLRCSHYSFGVRGWADHSHLLLSSQSFSPNFQDLVIDDGLVSMPNKAYKCPPTLVDCVRCW